ncbi:MAG: hypothetical protein IPM64_14695 [Phycisphaerales bacterium]|nr:hypothetical protein [Phycisphaerales bacterium]
MLRRASPLLAVAIAATTFSGCHTGRMRSMVPFQDLSEAPPTPFLREPVLVTDWPRLLPRATVLGGRVILATATTPAEWEELRAALSPVRVEPDLSTSAVILIASCAGTPISGEWPLTTRSVRLVRGYAMVSTEFLGGTYLSDNTVLAEVLVIPGMIAPLVIEISGERYFPPLSPGSEVASEAAPTPPLPR